MKKELSKEANAIFFRIYSDIRDLTLCIASMILIMSLAQQFGILKGVNIGVAILGSLLCWSAMKVYDYL